LLLELAAHYRFQPRPVAVARGNDKGRVERSIRYVRENFFAARTYRDLDDLNAQADAWCAGQAADRTCPEQHTGSVREVWIEEQPRLLALPENPFPSEQRLEVRIHKTPYARFDRSLTRGLIELLDSHGAQALQAAVVAALASDGAHLASVRHFIDIQAHARGQLPPVAVRLPAGSKISTIAVRPHALGDYDKLHQENDDESDTEH